MRTASPAETATPTIRPGSGEPIWLGSLGIGHRTLADRRGQRAVDDLHFAWLAVELEKDRPHAVGVRFAHGEQLDDQRLARLDLDQVLGARSGPKKKIDVGRIDVSEYVRS